MSQQTELCVFRRVAPFGATRFFIYRLKLGGTVVMNRKILALFISVMCIILCSCSHDTDNSSNITEKINEKGTISNPYSMSDVIEFISYGFYYETNDNGEPEQVAKMATIRISNMAIRSDIVFDSLDNGESYWFITFDCEVIDSDFEGTIDISKQFIHFGCINTDGIASSNKTYTFYDTANVPDFSQLEVMQGYNVKVGALIVSESGGDLSLIKIEYKNDKGNDNTIYIDATQ